MEKILTDGMRFVDEFGRERIFSGVNIVDKNSQGDKYAFDVTHELLDGFVKKGINIIRLGFTWALLEPKPGEYNDAYLDSYEKIIDMANEHGIYVYLDMHQDLFSSKTQGDGAPDWATLTDGRAAKPQKFVWAEGYFWGRACHRAFDNFWDNKQVNGKGLLEWFADCWAYVAERFKDKENLFGFDFFNEPFPGKDGGKIFRKIIGKLVWVTLTDSRISKSKLIKYGLSAENRHKVLDFYDDRVFPKIVSAGNKLIYKFDTERYSPFLDRMGEAVRKVTDNGILFADNCYYSNLGIPCSIHPITVNGKADSLQCFEPHGYDIMVDTPEYKYANNSRVGTIFDEHRRTQERLNVPCLVGEWGGFGGEGEDWLPHIEFLMDKFDSYKWSNTYWHYQEGFTDSVLMKVFCRPYPKAIAGEIEEYKVDRKNRVFALSFNQETQMQNIIYVPDEPVEIILDGASIFPEFNGTDLLLTAECGKHNIIIKY